MVDPLALALEQSKKLDTLINSRTSSRPPLDSLTHINLESARTPTQAPPPAQFEREAFEKLNSLFNGLSERLATLENESAKLWSQSNLRSMDVESRLLQLEQSRSGFVYHFKDSGLAVAEQSSSNDQIGGDLTPKTQSVQPEAPSGEQADKPRSSKSKDIEEADYAADVFGATPSSVSRKSMWSNEAEPFRPEYQFQGSVWDLTAFIGFSEVGFSGTLLTVLLLSINILVQLSFCIIVYYKFSEFSFDEDARDGLQLFRDRTAHDAQHADRVNGYTLAQGICNKNKSFSWRQNRYHFASSQLNTLEAVDNYLSDQDGSFRAFFNGELMCMLALACWCLAGLEEIRSIYNFFCAIVAIPRRRHTMLHRSSAAFTWKSISYFRFAICMKIVVLRLSCCCFLSYFGCVWLSYTHDVEALLLNAVALSFVMGVDEILYEALAPLPCKRLVDMAAPIQEALWIHFKGVDAFSVLALLAFPFFTGIFIRFWVEDMISGMKEVRNTLCSGNLTFSYSTDAMGVVWYQTWRAKNSDPLLKGMDDAAQRSVREMRVDVSPYLANPTHSVLEVTTKQFSELVDFVNKGCSDILQDETHPERSYHHFLDVFAASHPELKGFATDCPSACATIANLSFAEGRFIRFVCSETCGCRRPDALIPSSSAYYGCTTHCFRTHEFKSKLYNMSCTDPSVGNLAQSDFWNHWISFMRSTRAKYGNIRASTWADGMESYGCNFLKEFTQSLKESLCEGTNPFVNMRAFAPICPEVCECNNHGSQFCNPYCHWTRNATA